MFEKPSSFVGILCSDNLSNQLCQNSLFREIFIQITNWSFIAPLSAILSVMQDYLLLNQEITHDLILKQHPEVLFLSRALPNPNPRTLQVSFLIRFIFKHIVICTLQVPQNMLCSNQVNMSRIHDELAQCVRKKANLWSRICQVHQGPNHLMIHHSINRF